MDHVLSLDVQPIYSAASFRAFEAHEKHITRYCSQDVLLMVYEGTLRFSEDGVPVEVHEGEYYIQRHGLLQEGIIESDMPKYYYIHFRGEFRKTRHNIPLRGKIEFSELFPLFRQLEILRLENASITEKASVLFAVLGVLRRASRSSEHNEHNQIIRKVLSVVAENIRRPYTLDEIAKLCGYSKNHVITVFRTEMGKTPCAYITAVRLEMVKQHLLDSDCSLEQIAEECGFGSYNGLYKAFVRQEGCSPIVWKKRYREGAVRSGEAQ